MKSDISFKEVWPKFLGFKNTWITTFSLRNTTVGRKWSKTSWNIKSCLDLVAFMLIHQVKHHKIYNKTRKGDENSLMHSRQQKSSILSPSWLLGKWLMPMISGIQVFFSFLTWKKSKNMACKMKGDCYLYSFKNEGRCCLGCHFIVHHTWHPLNAL